MNTSTLLNKVKHFFVKNNDSSRTITKDLKKILLADNKKISDDEYQLACKICDVLISISKAAGNEVVSPPQGGVFWEDAKHGNGPYGLHMRKDRVEIDHSFLFNTRFRDFPTIAYEYDRYTPKPDFWVRRFHRLSSVMPEKWQVKIPAQFGEIGWNLNGYPVNRLTAINQERINVMRYAGILSWLEQKHLPKILEIGSGGGELGYVFAKALPNCVWINCDILACLAYSAIHLAIMLPKMKHYIYVGNLELPDNHFDDMLIRSPSLVNEMQGAIVHIPHFLLGDFSDNLQLNLAYNNYSFGEMPPASVEQYSGLLQKFLKADGVLFEQNGFFSAANSISVRDVLSKGFNEILWAASLRDSNRIKTGAMHIWCNNDLKVELDRYAATINSSAILNSFYDFKDAEDVNISSLEPWGDLKAICPNGI